MTNWAQVQAHDPDPNAGNNEDSEETTVVPGTGFVSGYVWNDLDGDGMWDAGEPGLNGWTVYVDLNDDGLLQAGEPWFVTQTDGQHDGAFWFTNLPLGSHVVREWVPEAWRQTFPAGIDGAHRVASPIQGDFGQTAAPNFGNNLIQVIQFITPLSVLRQDAALPDQRFIRPADDPLTAWQGLNPALLLQDYLDVLAPWQAYPVQNASATTLRYEVTFERHVQPPGDGFLMITDEQLNPLAGDTVTIDIPAGQTRRFFVFYDQPCIEPLFRFGVKEIDIPPSQLLLDVAVPYQEHVLPMIPAGMKCVQTVMSGRNSWMKSTSLLVFSRSSWVRTTSEVAASSPS